MIDTETAIGIVAAPGIVAAVIGILKPLLLRWLPSDAIPAIALLLSIGYVLLAWQAEVIEAENAFVAVLLGVTVGVGAVGARETLRQVRPAQP